LTIGQHGHWRQAHPDDDSCRALDRDWSEEDVSNDAVVLGDERQASIAGVSQPLDEVRLGGLTERKLVHTPNCGRVFRSLGANLRHPLSAPARLRQAIEEIYDSGIQ
jgi:hypothetical protein